MHELFMNNAPQRGEPGGQSAKNAPRRPCMHGVFPECKRPSWRLGCRVQLRGVSHSWSMTPCLTYEGWEVRSENIFAMVAVIIVKHAQLLHLHPGPLRTPLYRPPRISPQNSGTHTPVMGTAAQTTQVHCGTTHRTVYTHRMPGTMKRPSTEVFPVPPYPKLHASSPSCKLYKQKKLIRIDIKAQQVLTQLAASHLPSTNQFDRAKESQWQEHQHFALAPGKM